MDMRIMFHTLNFTDKEIAKFVLVKVLQESVAAVHEIHESMNLPISKAIEVYRNKKEISNLSGNRRVQMLFYELLEMICDLASRDEVIPEEDMDSYEDKLDNLTWLVVLERDLQSTLLN